MAHRRQNRLTVMWAIALIACTVGHGLAMEGKALYATTGWADSPNRIYLVDLETGAVDTIYRNGLRKSVGMPNFSPNGEEVGFILGGESYYAMKNNGTEFRWICDMGGTKTKGGDWAWTQDGIFWVTHENDVYRADPETGERRHIHHIDNVNYSNGLWASDDGRRILVWVKEPHHGVLLEFSSNWTQVDERITDCWGHGNWMPGDGSVVVAGAWGNTRGQLPDAAHKNFVAFNWSDISVNKAWLSGASGETSVYGLRWCANNRDLIGFETDTQQDFVIDWRTETLTEIPIGVSGPRDGSSQPDLGGLWQGPLTVPPPGPPRIALATSEVHWPQANGITRVYINNVGGDTLDAVTCEIIEGGDGWLNLLFTGPEYQIERGNTQVIRAQLTSNTLPQGVYYATVAVYGGGAIDTAYFTCVLNKDMPVYVPGELSARSYGGSYVELSWADKSADETGFSIERAASGGQFEEIATVGADVTTYIDSGLAGGTYSYRLRAVKSGEYSGYTPAVEVELVVIPTIIILNPDGGSSYSPGDTIHIQWEAIDIPIVQIMYSADEGENWSEVSDTGGISELNPHWGDFPWVAPAVESDLVMLWVRSYQEAEFGSFTDVFSITSVSAVSPSGPGTAARQPFARWSSDNTLRMRVPSGTRAVRLLDLKGRVVAARRIDGCTKEITWQLPAGARSSVRLMQLVGSSEASGEVLRLGLTR
ncbi:MAG: hypothetical protein GF331_24225 [Chitinivibrionales bacterium]|nr:hypothetical protein [Chitinivibrionales bacterium]